MAKLTTFAKLSIAVRDAWDALEPTAKARDLPFAKFCEWVQKVFANRAEMEMPPAVKDILLFVTEGNDYRNYEKTQLIAKLQTSSNGLYFRTAAAVDMMHNETDRRVRDVFEHTSREGFPLNHRHLVCSFFTDSGLSWTKPKKDKTYAYKTEPVTRFEQLIFVSVIIDITKSINEERPAKKRKITRSIAQPTSYPPSLTLSALTTEKAVRIGSAIQQVVRAWDTYAASFGFDGVESMFLPYLQLTSDFVQFRVIQSRTEGFLRSSQAKRFEPHASLTHKKEETFAHVCDRTNSLDECLRTLATEFFQDIHSMTHAHELYALPSHIKWPGFVRFKVHNEGVPQRFSKIPLRLTNTVRKELETEMRLRSAVQNYVRTAPRVKEIVGNIIPVRPERSAAETPLEPFSTKIPANGTRAISNQAIKKKMEELEDALKPYLRLYRSSFEEIIELEDLIAPTDPLSSSGAQLLLCDPPYNTRRQSDKKNSAHDCLTNEDMDEVVKTAAMVLRKGGHGIIFCSIQQFMTWRRKFKASTTDLGRGQKRPTFTVDSMPLIVERHPSVITVPPGKKCSLVNGAELAVHIKKNGLTYKEEEAMVNYKNFNYVPSTFPAFKNIINNVMWLLPGEQLRGCNSNDPSKTFALRAEQKPVALLKELICRFSQPGDIVVDLFAGTFSTAHACMTLPNHRRFVGCEVDEACFAVASNHVLRRTASAIATKATDIKLLSKFLPLVCSVHEQYAPPEMLDPRWNAPKGMPPYQCFPDHILSHLASTWDNRGFLIDCMNKPFHEWPRQYQGLLEQSDTKQLLQIDAAANGLFVATSTIKHQMAGQGVFAAKTFQKGDLICSYFGTLVYHDLGKRRQMAKKYGGGVLGVDIHRYNKYALQVNIRGHGFNAVKDLLNGRKAICVVPTPFTMGGYINDARYHHDDEEFEAHRQGQLLFPRPQNARLMAPQAPTHPSQLVQPTILVVEAQTLISPGSEIFVDYGIEGFVYHSNGNGGDSM